MVCYRPIDFHFSRDTGISCISENNFNKQIFAYANDYNKSFSILKANTNIKVPCHNCEGCRIDRAKTWTLRLQNHNHTWKYNSIFLTLTYDDDNLPFDSGLDISHFQKFMKRLRKHYFGSKKSNISYYHVGEYGDKYGRPHYHCIIYNFRPDDEIEFKQYKYKHHVIRNTSNSKLFTSQTLINLWGKGFVNYGEVTSKSCNYVAKYVMKKINGKDSELKYMSYDTGIVRKKEYMSCSKGIGKEFFIRYYTEFTNCGYFNLDGFKYGIPKYYLNLLKSINIILYDFCIKRIYDSFDTLISKLQRTSEFLNAKYETLLSKLLTVRKRNVYGTN